MAGDHGASQKRLAMPPISYVAPRGVEHSPESACGPERLLSQGHAVPAAATSVVRGYANGELPDLAATTDFLEQTERIAEMYARRLGACQHSAVKCEACASSMNEKLAAGTHVLMPVKADGEMAHAIESYYAKTVKYRDRPNCDALKADCWSALMAYYAMVDVVRARKST